MRIGLGYDLHRLVRGRPLFLGGVEIPWEKGLLGHSDGDALVHALIDALLGASGEGDIGACFPDTDPAFRGIRSLELLRRVMARLRKKRFRVVNVDAVVAAEAPKLGPYFAAMKKTLAPLLGVSGRAVGLKAKTNEGTGLIGRGGAIACWAVVLLEEKG
ncbi:MAG: 2-C-methyl-D-erythritol 2,4-cyclodiphosphate synthase [Candidatus Aminicenantes bacterium]|nr:2-C-methyl-D-erythritol 2,4-cyclodiphosphate synthase [Candidatus Aminicenantes bacterium]